MGDDPSRKTGSLMRIVSIKITQFRSQGVRDNINIIDVQIVFRYKILRM